MRRLYAWFAAWQKDIGLYLSKEMSLQWSSIQILSVWKSFNFGKNIKLTSDLTEDTGKTKFQKKK